MHFLSSIFKATDYTPVELELILSSFTEKVFAKNEFLLKEGNTASDYWFPETGYIRSFAIDTEGNDISTGFYTGGNIVMDWSSFFLRQPAREYIQAIGECHCWQIGFERFQELFHSIAAFREQGRSNLVRSFLALKQHSISLITDTAAERYRRLMAERPDILQHVPLKQVASYLGMTDTSLSRIRKTMAGE